MRSATSGIRATSARMNTIAVITPPPDRYEKSCEQGRAWPSSARLVDGTRQAALVERDDRVGFGVVRREVTRRAADGALPLTVDVDQSGAVALEPPQDALRLLRRGRRGGPVAGKHRLGTEPQLLDPGTGVGAGGDHARGAEAAVSHDMDLPATRVVAAACHQVAACREGRESLRTCRSREEGPQPISLDLCVLESCLL